MLGTLSEPYIVFLRAKGLRRRSIIYLHALRNASGPIVTVTGIQFGVLLGGAIVIENLFALPGVGRLVVTAISERDYVVVQGGVLVVACLFIVVNLLTDLLYGLLDPRAAEAMSE
jgi:peptide/nickel transport system permease protein